MTTTANIKNLQHCKSIFSLIVRQMLAFTLSTDLVREVNNLSPNFIMIFNDKANSNSDR